MRTSMKAVQFVGKGRPPELREVPKPEPIGPNDAVVRIAGAGVCRTDIHILDGEAPLQPAPPPPFTLGHENAGWIDAVGPAVQGLKRGDPVILHPGASCGACSACRAGSDMYCPTIRFPGVDGSDGGYAEFVRTLTRAVVPLPPGTEPALLAPLADAGITAYHAVNRVQPFLDPDSVVVVVGVGGLGHLGIQLLRAMTPGRIIAVDLREDRLAFARQLGAELAISANDPQLRDLVRRSTADHGVDVVLDFVAEGNTPALAMQLLRMGGTYSVVGYGGRLDVPTVDLITRELRIQGNFVGTYRDLTELMELSRRGSVTVEAKKYRLSEAPDAIQDLRDGKVLGRAVLTP